MSPSPGSLAEGDVRVQVVVDDLTRTQIVMYAGASGDYNPLHSDEVFAREGAHYPGIFAHGMLTMGMTGRAITDWVGTERLTSFGGRFRGLVWPGDTLTATLEVVAVEDHDGRRTARLDVTTTNQHGEAVFTGYATVADAAEG